jgi:hypothetical protein
MAKAKQTTFEVTNAESLQPVLAVIEDALGKGEKVEVSVKVEGKHGR